MKEEEKKSISVWHSHEICFLISSLLNLISKFYEASFPPCAHDDLAFPERLYKHALCIKISHTSS